MAFSLLNTSASSLLLLPLLLLLPVPTQSNIIAPTRATCPDNCGTCVAEIVKCESIIRPRTTLPLNVPSSIERLAFKDQKFLQPSLSAANFSQFAPPHISLRQLSIRHCGLRHLAPRVFSALTKLESLDLSSNDDLDISNDAFHGLKMRHLLLNDIARLRFQPQAFRGLEVTSLSLSNCQLSGVSLSYDLLHPVSRSLTHLFLGGNRIDSLEARLGLIFDKLEELDLSGNPFQCDCRLRWMTSFFQKKTSSSSSSALQKGKEPLCSAPAHVKGRRIREIRTEEIVCEAPEITELSLHVREGGHLVCTGQQRAWAAPLHISWTSGTESSSTTNVGHYNVSKSLQLHREGQAAQYRCTVNNSAGSASATVSVDWPSLGSMLDLDAGLEVTPPRQQQQRPWHDTFFERRFTLLEIIAAVTGTVLFTGLLFVVLHRLVLVHCVLHPLWPGSGHGGGSSSMERRSGSIDPHHLKKKKTVLLAGSGGIRTLSLASTTDAALYSSNSQTYDQPGPPCTGGSTLCLPTASISSPNIQQQQQQQQFLDFKTQRKIYRKL